MTKAEDLARQLVQARNELNNLRKTVRGLQAEHRKDVSALKEVIAGTPTLTSTPQAPKAPQQQAVLSDEHLFHGWRPIGHIKSWFRTKNGTPRQGSVSSLTRGVLRLAPHTFTNPHHALQGLEDFSHVWILFVFDKNEERGGRSHCRSKVAPPRLGGQRVGVFGTRSPHRPNPLGLTLARLDKVEGDCLHLSGLDILDGTPVLDIKPYILQYDAPPVVASHFTDPTRVASRTSLDKDVDSLFHDDRLLGGKFREKTSEGETKPNCDGALNSMQREVYKHGISKDENVESLIHNAKPQRGKYSHERSKEQNKPKSERGKRYVEKEEREETEMLDVGSDIKEAEKGHHVEKIREDEKKMRLNEMVHVHGDTEESRKCREEKVVVKRSEENEGAVLIPESQYEKGDEERSEEKGKDAVAMASWVSEPPTVALQVLFNPIAEKQVQAFSRQAKDEKYRLEYLADGEELREAITSVLRQDPRSVYRREKCASLLYYLCVDSAHVTAWFEGSCAEVLRVQPLSTQSHNPVH
ncbi:tRNA (adenine(37)-N6)-methyltransferase-like [Eriocheir sinensis]|uniref:tRNA (adenine(37)-N6)-methyltransferase-like n=1 Tax=Eriocheir sinensis TaxID=95602 RepID=UPI0021CA06ED|nr:tRNA (adenine(37)-N6)-methyltransferase-like [Eriocheir sinensis]